MSTVVALSAEAICNKIPGLTRAQVKLCQARPDALAAIGDGARLALAECQRQFRNRRWNCTAVGNVNAFGHVILIGKKEGPILI